MDLDNALANSHTHCQAAPANAQTKARQRVCLSNRTTKTIDKPTDEKEHRSGNSTYPKGGVSCSKDSFVVNQKLVLRINICGENRHLRQARNRYMQPKRKTYYKLNLLTIRKSKLKNIKHLI